MNIDQVAVQFYTLREHAKTPAEIAVSVKRIAEMGYRAIQASGMGPIAEEELLQICSDNGVTICATHEPGTMILNEPRKVVDRLQKLRCRYTAFPYLTGVDLTSPDAVSSFIQKLNDAGRVLADAGQVLTFHNHHIEFRKLEGQRILDMIFERTDPRYVQAEIDTYWVQYGGCSPEEWCRQLRGRLPLLHLKDYRINNDNQVEFAEIGYGNLNFPAIIRAAEASGCEWFIVEQDKTPGDPFDSLRMSFDFIVGNLIES